MRVWVSVRVLKRGSVIEVAEGVRVVEVLWFKLLKVWEFFTVSLIFIKYVPKQTKLIHNSLREVLVLVPSLIYFLNMSQNRQSTCPSAMYSINKLTQAQATKTIDMTRQATYSVKYIWLAQSTSK